MGDCIFCKIIKGEVSCSKIYEDEDFIVMLDAYPSSPGHALLVPKKHEDNVYSMDPKLLEKVSPLTAKVAKAIKRMSNCQGINILQNNGEAAGQTVNHFHVHIIPRFDDDNITMQWVCEEMQEGQIQEIADELIRYL